MDLRFNAKKGFGTKDQNITSAWFEFEYTDVDKINSLEELFKINIGEFETNATISSTANPIVIDTAIGTGKYQQGEADATLNDVIKCMIKLDIYINDQVSGMIRIETLTIK